RDHCTQFSLDLENHNALFAHFLARLMTGEQIGPELSLLKISQSELFGRITEYAMEIAGPTAALFGVQEGGVGTNPSGQFLQARPATIYGGSSEIQRNIIARAVLGLPVTSTK